MKKEGSCAAIYRWHYETAVSKGRQFLMPLVSIKILFWRELKLVSLILQYLFPRKSWLQVKASEDGNDPSFTLTKFVCKVDQKEGGIPTLSHYCRSRHTSPSGWFEGRRDCLLLSEGFQRTYCSQPLDLPDCLIGLPRLSYIMCKGHL